MLIYDLTFSSCTVFRHWYRPSNGVSLGPFLFSAGGRQGTIYKFDVFAPVFLVSIWPRRQRDVEELKAEHAECGPYSILN